MKKKILKIIFLPLYSLLVIEVAIRLILLINPIFVRILDFDSASERLRWVKRHQTVDILYSFEDYSPTLGWVLQPNLDEFMMAEEVLNTNSHGLRATQEYAYEPGDSPRVVVLGDSFTFGLDVSDDETYVAYLDELLPEWEALNLGVPGYGHDQMLIYLQEEGLNYRPNVVLVGFVHLDLYRNMMHFKNYAKPRFVLDNQGQLRLTHTPVPPPQEFLKYEFFRPKTLDMFYILQHKLLWLSGVQKERMWELSAAILDEIARLSREAGATPLFVYLPTELKQGSEEEFFTWYCQQRSVACYSLQERFIEEIPSEAEFRSFTNHWQPGVHQVAAEGIREFMLEQEMLAGR